MMRIHLALSCAILGLACSSKPAAKPQPVVEKLTLSPGQVRVFTPVEAGGPKAKPTAKNTASVPTRLNGLRVRVSHASSAPAHKGPTSVRAVSLSKAEALKVLAPVQALNAQTGDTRKAALRSGPKAPSRGTLTVTNAQLTSGTAPPTVNSLRSLRVLRRAPVGRIGRTGGVSVTFSQPMTELGRLKKLTNADVPVRVMPAVKGTWRWIDTRTLILEPAGKLQRATRFTVEVPAGTKSVSNAGLAKTVRWTFDTPAPKVTQRWPRYSSDPLHLDQVFVIAFDQPVDPGKVLATMKLTDRKSPHALRVVPATELAATKLVPRKFYKHLKAGHWFAYRPVKPLPMDTKLQLVVGPGTPSTLGPLKTLEPQKYGLRTHGKFTLKEIDCTGSCRIDDMFRMEFSNPVDKTDAQRLIRVTPRPKKMRIEASGNNVFIHGGKRVGQTFRLRVNGRLRDVFGQRLGKTRTHTYKIKERPWWGSTLKGDSFVVLDPAGKKSYQFLSIKHRAIRTRVYAVTPAEHEAFSRFAYGFRYSHRTNSSYYYGYGSRGGVKTPPGRLVQTKVIRPRRPGKLSVQSVDLRAAIPAGLGHAIVVVEPVRPLNKKRKPAGIVAWVQSTRIGVTSVTDPSGVLVMTTDLRNGKPLSGVRVGPIDTPARTQASNSKGLLRLDAHRGVKLPLLVARKGKDSALAPWTGKSRWHFGPRSRRLLWHVFNDRHLYRPGETVSIKGWVRSLTRKKGGDVELSGMRGKALSYKLYDAQRVELAKGTLKLDGLDGFDLKLKLPADVNLGWTRLTFTFPKDKRVSSRYFTHGFKVEEFRRPEFEVSASADAGPHIVGGSVTARVRAAYYTGGALPGADLSWRLHASPAQYTPPNQQQFFFGIERPWWHHRRAYRRRGRYGLGGYGTAIFKAKTDATGRHALRVDLTRATKPRTVVVRAEASVQDINRQTWTGGTSFMVHPSSLYVGVRPTSRFLDPGTLAIDTIVSNIAGKPVSGRTVTVTAKPWDQSGKAQTCTITSTATAKRCVLNVSLPGVHRVSATVSDDKKRLHKAELYVFVSGGRFPGEDNLKADKVVLTPDKKLYKPGDKAKVVVRSPFFPAEGIMTISRNAIQSKRRFKVTGPTTTLTVPVSAKHAPSAFVHVSLVGRAPRRNAKGKPIPGSARPAHANGLLRLKVTPVPRILNVKVTPAAPTLAPGDKTAVTVVVRDSAGKPVADAEVTLVAVDESVLALGNYKIPDPISQTFYNTGLYYSAVGWEDLRRWVNLQKTKGGRGTSMVMEEGKMGRRSRGGQYSMKKSSPKAVVAGPSGSSAKKNIAVRKNFSPLAVFAPTAKTGSNGRAKVSFKLPDNLTRYRVTAVVASGKNRFGRGESSITARRLLMVRPSAPRFLSYGDKLEVPVVVQNLSKKQLTVRVAARATNLRLTDTWGWQFNVGAGQRAEVRFPATTRSAGTARLQFVGIATGTNLADAAQISLPVWTPATSEAFAVYGQIKEGGISQPVAPPKSVIPSVGGLDITTSSTALTTLHDAVQYLVKYPYDGSEQTASRVLAVAALRDLLAAFADKNGPSAAEMNARMQRDLKLLESRQRYDGSVRMWSGSSHDFPYVSVHAAHAFVRAKEKGYRVSRRALLRAKRYLDRIDRKIPKSYSAWARHAIESYAIYVRHLSGDKNVQRRAKNLASKPGPTKVSIESSAWLLSVLAKNKGAMAQRKAIRKHFTNRITETASAAHFTTSYDAYAHQVLHSARRTDAIVLEALIADQPQSDVIGKVVKGLLAKRVKGRWLNTQENAFVLLALERYFRAYEKVTPDMVASVWLGGKYAGKKQYRGRSVAQHKVHVPMSVLSGARGNQNLIVHKRGKGRLYYRLGLSYAPKNLNLGPAVHGFVVDRKYEAVDDKSDVSQAKDGTWRVRAGARVRVSVSMVAPAQRHHMVLVDKLPAGFEAINPSLSTSSRLSGRIRSGIRHGWRWYYYWFDHQNLRDERVEVFSSNLHAGSYVYSYVARATTPGTFTAAPAKAEELYNPETFGRSGSARVVVY